MGRVHRLPEEVVSKIAAGEVIDRPASAVKELIENALDARAGKIELHLEAGGLRHLEVRDDGHGMSPEDAELALERHATSKIETEADLFSVTTLGFRGEALPSMAAVSRLSVRTRTEGADHGFLLACEGGRIKRREPCPLERGTWVTVSDLFFNTPARRKFLRSERSELGACVQVVSRLALGRPDVDFRVQHDGRPLVDFPLATRLRRIVDVLGERTADKLLAVDHAEGPLKVEGLLGSPLVHWPNSAGLYLYLNGRYFRDRVLAHAVSDAFSQTLPSGRFPLGVLLLSIDPGRVDVNVHPQKIEVRFRDPSEVYRVVRAATAHALGPRLFKAEAAPASPPPPEIARAPLSTPEARPQVASRLSDAVPPEAATTSPVASPALEAPAREQTQTDRPRPLLPPSLSILGQLRNTFILCETPDGLVIVDQHTAHERVLFDRLQAQLTNGGVRQQALLLPETFTPTPSERVALEELRPCLGDLGLDLEPFGSAFVVNAIPSGLDVPRATEFLRDLLREYAERPVSKDEDPRRRFLDLMACRAAVKAGDAMNEAEQEELISRVFGTASAFTCPHGRPILLEWRYEMLEKAFKRH